MNDSDIMGILRNDVAIYDLFTRKEEYAGGLRDGFGRFPYYASNDRNVLEPIVSKYLNENGLMVEYPDGHQFAVCFSHDVDVLCKSNYFRKELDSFRSLMIGDPRGALNRLRDPRIIKPFLDSREIMAIEEEYGARSSFYFLAVEKDDPDYTYDIMSVEDDLRFIIESGWEVGLHGSQPAHNNLTRIMKEKSRIEAALGEPVQGYRNHFLRFKTPLTWSLLQQAGFKYDTTFGYADCIGFRGGICHPFKPFDLETNSTIDIVEIPLVVMDATLFHDYMRLDLETAWNLVKNLIDTVEKQKGTMNILWHNIYMRGDHLKLYNKILKYCYERNAWMPCGKDLQERTLMDIKS